ncbi:MAG TPA: hypothetical protein V6C90_18485 [Coleofasciculaceae cyanobacterium]
MLTLNLAIALRSSSLRSRDNTGLRSATLATHLPVEQERTLS